MSFCIILEEEFCCNAEKAKNLAEIQKPDIFEYFWRTEEGFACFNKPKQMNWSQIQDLPK